MSIQKMILAFLSSLGFIHAFTASNSSFNPRRYSKEVTTCPAVRRGLTEDPVDIQAEYIDINPTASQTILMVHGWPGLWSTWSNQIQEFEEGYHLVIPDLRGFGESKHPGEVQSSGSNQDIVEDLVCVLNDAGVSSAICMGHDWGSTICYEAARLRPDIFTAVVGAVVPYLPSTGEYTSLKNIAKAFPALTYTLYFNSQLDKAVAELDQDVRRTVRATLRNVKSPPPDSFLKDANSFLSAWKEVKEIPPIPFFTQDEEDYLVEQYEQNGFRNTLYFYFEDNRMHSWKLANSQGNHTIAQPVLAIYPTQDPVADWAALAKVLGSAQYLPRLTTHIMPGAHWVNLEHPQEFNLAVKKWLKDLDGTIVSSHDEL